MKILVMGAGAIGSYFGAKLKLAGEDVYFADRGEHLRALKANGLRMRGPEGEKTVPIPSTDSPADLRLMTWCSSA
jgi:2-dehydropantoate 2-reductase